MALMKLTAFNGGMKGKIAGTIFQGGKMGQVVKNGIMDAVSAGAKLTKADAGLVIPFKANWTKVATSWRTLDAAQRLAWTTAAPNFPATNRFGDSYTPSGFQVFMAINVGLENGEHAALVGPPAPGGVVNCPPITILYDALGPYLNLSAFTQEPNYIYTLYATGNISPGKAPKKSDFKAIMIIGNPETFPLNFTVEYEGVFGNLPITANMWFRMECMNPGNAQKGVSSYFQLNF